MDEQSKRLSRRDALKVGLGAGVALSLNHVSGLAAEPLPSIPPQVGGLIERAIPSSGERLPIVGMGTARNYEDPTPEQMPPLREVIRQFPEMGGRVLDTAPSYGRAEVVVGELMAELKNRDKFFIATKVSLGGRGGRGGRGAGGGGGGGAAAGPEQATASLDRSLSRFHTDHIDLMQVWNMSQPDVLLPLLDEWKAAKKIRYTGVTTSSDGQYEALEALMMARKFDFIQVDFAIDNRNAQDRLLPLAADRGFGVLINLPFGRSRPFEKVQGKALPGWAKDIDCADWSQVFLKYVVSHPAVTAAIPGTEKVEYLKLNLGVARGRLPDAALRKRIEQDFDAL
ncbi:MAG: aldo/keto reductase [Gemmatimonadetes bacterium]|nr:aldo/keto reductase [Gemmatimonadota bacterium]